MPDSQPKLVDTQKLELAVADLLIPEIQPHENPDPIAIANRLIRGQNQNTIATVKTQHGVENLHSRVSPLEQTVQTLVARNETIDGYMKTISECAIWVKEKLAWWLVKLIQLFMIGIAYLIVDYVFLHMFHTELPRSIAPSP